MQQRLDSDEKKKTIGFVNIYEFGIFYESKTLNMQKNTKSSIESRLHILSKICH